MLKLDNVRVLGKNSVLMRGTSLEMVAKTFTMNGKIRKPTMSLGFPDVYYLKFFLLDYVSPEFTLAGVWNKLKLYYSARDNGKEFSERLVTVVFNTPQYDYSVPIITYTLREATLFRPGVCKRIDGCNYEELMPVRAKYFR